MIVIRALIGGAGFLTVVLAMVLVSFGWWLTQAWPPPQRKA
jgi:hypothetical protein